MDAEMHKSSPDRRRFERLVLPHLDRLVAFARRLGADHAEAQDWTQDAVTRAWRAFSQLDDESSARAWLFRILRTVAADEARTRARRRALVDVTELEERHEEMVASEDPDPLEALLSAATAATVQAALDAIPQEFADAVELHDLHELKYREIADVLGIPLGTVMSRISRGRRLLAVVLARRAGGAIARHEETGR
jgi:RNA polymerase sigma-70 factor, ECF subfamily